MTRGYKYFIGQLLIAAIAVAFFSGVAFANERKVLLAQAKSGGGTKLVYVADIVSIQGNGLQVKRINSPTWLKGKVNMPDYLRDVLQTDGNTVACIEFMNGSQVGINKNTTIEIVSSSGTRELTDTANVQKMTVKKGVAWGKIRGQGNDLKVETNRGVLGIKGTEFVVETDPDTKTEKVTVLEGDVEYSTTEGKTETISPGDVITIGADATIQKRHEDIQKLRDALRLQFPNMDPSLQIVIGVFSAHVMGAMPADVNRAIGIANDALSLVDNPESFVKSQVTSRVPLPFGIPSSAGEEKKPEPAKNLKPSGGELISTYYPKFTWDKVEKAQFYRVLVTRNPLEKGQKDPQYYAFAETDKTELEYPDYARALKPEMVFYWTVIPLDADKKPIAPASEPASFTMANYAQLGIKGLYPCGDVPTPSAEMIFDWTPVQGVTKYKVEVSTNENMSSPILTKETEENFLVLDNPTQYFIKDKQYYWKVTPLEKESGVPEIQGVINRFKIKTPR